MFSSPSYGTLKSSFSKCDSRIRRPSPVDSELKTIRRFVAGDRDAVINLNTKRRHFSSEVASCSRESSSVRAFGFTVLCAGFQTICVYISEPAGPHICESWRRPHSNTTSTQPSVEYFHLKERCSQNIKK